MPLIPLGPMPYQKSPSKEKQSTPSKTRTSTEAPVANFSSTSSHESHSLKATTTNSNSETTKVTTTETFSKAAISEIVVTVPQEVVWKEEVRCPFSLM